MKPESVIIYERVLKGERWPVKYIGTATTKGRSVEILKYLFFEKLGIKDFETAKAALNEKFITEHQLKRILRSIEKPPELLPDEYDHILWLIFPERRRGKRSLIIKVYSEVLCGNRKNFPKGYFSDAQDGKYRAEICFKHMCRKILHLSGDKIALEFSHSNGIKTLAKFRLKILLNHVYFSLSDLVHHIYPQYYHRLIDYQAQRDKRFSNGKSSAGGGENHGNC
ncbi:MAG TPA: hypothetical protein DEB10_12935 [Ruminococcaceae bacterium]|jgi:hypothetical protein|nr:hypothetical protein [Oscillospiraceae bacterium]